MEYAEHWRIRMNKRMIFIIILILSGLSLLISLQLFWNMGVYVDEYNTTPSVVYGSEFWLDMSWIRLFLLGSIIIIASIGIFKTNIKTR